MNADNDDDGETAAGGRLAHLLQILVSPGPDGAGLSRDQRLIHDKRSMQELESM